MLHCAQLGGGGLHIHAFHNKHAYETQRKNRKKIGKKKKKGVRVEMLGNLPQALTGKLHADWFSSAKNSGLHSASEMSI